MEDNPSYEFGVTIGQAFNLAVELMDAQATKRGELPDRANVLVIFRSLLAAKLDPDFRGAFGQYLRDKQVVSTGKVVSPRNSGAEPAISIKKGI